MTSPSPSEPPRVPLMRIVGWSAVAVVLLLGLILYFRYAGSVRPLLGTQ
jgi:hypothetical protein